MSAVSQEWLSVGTTLHELLRGLTESTQIPEVGEIVGLQIDSRRVADGDVFCAIAGTKAHGLEFAQEVTMRGAAAILFDPSDVEVGVLRDRQNCGVPMVPVPALRDNLGVLADRFFGLPSRHVQVIGITGTNGKTSCSHFIAQALGDAYRAGVIGTLGWGTVGRLRPTDNTTPSVVEMHSALAQMRQRGARVVAIEASSHGLAQGRLAAVRMAGAVFTNLGHDHLDYHGDHQAYLTAKLKLFAANGLKFAVVNRDDAHFAQVVAAIPSSVRVLGFSRNASSKAADTVVAGDVNLAEDGLAFNAWFNGESAWVRAPVLGGYNVENLLATLAVLIGLGFDMSYAARALGRVRGVAGRMERVPGMGGPSVIVDYAHTPDALEKVLSALRPLCKGKLWVVFGCGGDRDRSKRPLMGEVASRLADRVVLTDDNPRSESSRKILDDILVGCRADAVTVIPDRRAALRYALSQAGANDLVLIAGKGHEDTQDIQGIKHPFSDRTVAAEILAELDGVP